MTNMTWKTLLIFLHRGSEEMDGFIVDVISPVIEKLLAEGAITSWFSFDTGMVVLIFGCAYREPLTERLQR